MVRKHLRQRRPVYGNQFDDRVGAVVGRLRSEGDDPGTGRAGGLFSRDVFAPCGVRRRARPNEGYNGYHAVIRISRVDTALRGQRGRKA